MSKPYWFKAEGNGNGSSKHVLVLDEQQVREACKAPHNDTYGFSLNFSIFRNICTELGIEIGDHKRNYEEMKRAPR